MPSKKTAKSAAATVPVPQSREQAQSQISRLGAILREHAVLKAEVDQLVANVVDQYAAQLDALVKQRDELQAGLQIWCDANRATLTDNHKTKTVNLVTGEVAWRQRPPSVGVRGADEVLKALREAGLSTYIRTTEEVNKQGILELASQVEKITVEDLAEGTEAAQQLARQKLDLARLQGIKGITLVRGLEDFSVTPFEAVPAADPT